MLMLALTGHGPVGKQVFGKLNQPAPEASGKKGR
jgi:hypothetical protein